jgi:4-amino-4-deoxy-L-arabinose transferase-like glycosyltransferase
MHVDEASALAPLARMKPEGMDLNPHFFHWGTFHTYVAGAALGSGHVLGLLELRRDPLFYLNRPDQLARIYLAGRLLSVVLGAGTIAVVMKLAKRLGRLATGLTAAIFLSSCAVFVLYCHFFTPDVYLTFLFSLSVFLAVTAARRPGARVIWWAAGVAGLAASVKYNGVLAMVAVLYALRPLSVRRLLAAAGFFLAGFLVGTPYAVVAPGEFLDGLTWQMRHAGSTHGLVFLDTAPGWIYHAVTSLAYGLGWPLFAVVLGGVVLSTIQARQHRVWRILAWTGLAYYAVTGCAPLKFSRYLLPLLPLLAVLGAWGWVGTLRLLPRVARMVGRVLVGAAVLWGLLLCAAHIRVLVLQDTRLEAGRWLAAHAKPGDVVLLFGRPYFYTPPVDADRYSVVAAPLGPEAVTNRLPDWIVVSDYEYRPYLRLAARYPDEAGFVTAMLQGKLRVRGYRYVPSFFSRTLDVASLALVGPHVPHDLRYTHPTIVVLRKQPR